MKITTYKPSHFTAAVILLGVVVEIPIIQCP